MQASRSELAELQVQVKSHEDSLQHAYNQLAEASRDKARVRQQLLDNQAELTGVSPWWHVPQQAFIKVCSGSL